MTNEVRRVVITGVGAVTPLGLDVNTTWKNLIDGRHGIAPITQFDTTDYKAKLAAEIKNFDPREYLDKSETMRTDSNAQFAVAAADQAVADSGIAGKVVPERIAVYIGSGIGGIKTFSEEYDKLRKRGPKRVSPYFVPKLIANMASGMVAIRHGCKGPAIPTVTACASGSNAIGEALRLIRHGYADAVISGGCEASIAEIGVAGFVNMQALTVSEDPDAASLPFDKRRGGFVIAEGGAVIILEEYEHAVSRGANIYCEICGYGSTCDAYHITAPEPEGKMAALTMKQAMDEAGYTADDTVYINAHGTGTPLNDVTETKAIKKAFGEKKAAEIKISSTKSMTGHMLGAAGAMEAIACIKALQKEILPPTVNLKEPDPDCDLDYVAGSAEKYDASLMLSNSLGFGGHNACLAFRKVK